MDDLRTVRKITVERLVIHESSSTDETRRLHVSTMAHRFLLLPLFWSLNGGGLSDQRRRSGAPTCTLLMVA